MIKVGVDIASAGSRDWSACVHVDVHPDGTYEVVRTATTDRPLSNPRTGDGAEGFLRPGDQCPVCLEE